MCTVSMVGDHYDNKWKKPEYQQFFHQIKVEPEKVDKKDFDALKKEVEDMKALLKKAKIYDQDHGEPNCEIESKIAKLKEIAELMGVDISEVFK